ncbi:MAG: DUF58 domain-containing protein, partial [Gemmatimonadetes bacterium]|nr:DUF58 domain-containing protein [Gemmatimonadota bacterium]NIR76010.1 DUF58 domain-containing protein [Candidatus Kutchimonas denitrificans]NIS02202.1 DUF58 domain-containing protein [Gemmatimonadota bacterium]NIT68028.1 DUF58 domain-containing protein [Gemmatimonadota bacterium]NIU54054.1 DUF58 domain-containing protein [Gemmatimonadota bacterium]
MAATTQSVPREVLRQVKLIELRTRGLVNTVFSGEYQSVFKGHGMEFAEVREYAAGDDYRSIDWNVSARMGHPYVKKYTEERELTVLFAVDLSGSEQFGTRGRFKAELAAEVAAVLAMAAIKNNDRVGLVTFTDRVEEFVPPKKGRRHALRLIRDLLAFRPTGRGTDLRVALDYLGRIVRHRAIIFLISDFLDADFERSLKVVSRRHDVVAVTVSDPREHAIPDVGYLELVDAETDRRVVLDSGNRYVREQFEYLANEEEVRLRQLLRRLSIDQIEIQTDRSYVKPLIEFFHARERKL